MKNHSSQFLIAALIGFTLFASCVSKKKFVIAENGRIAALNRGDNLTKEVADLKTKVADLKNEFNAMQNELRLSNAKKDSYII